MVMFFSLLGILNGPRCVRTYWKWPHCIFCARSLGGNIKEIGYEDLRDMGNIMKGAHLYECLVSGPAWKKCIIQTNHRSVNYQFFFYVDNQNWRAKQLAQSAVLLIMGFTAGPNQVEVLEDELLSELVGENFLLAALVVVHRMPKPFAGWFSRSSPFWSRSDRPGSWDFAISSGSTNRFQCCARWCGGSDTGTRNRADWSINFQTMQGRRPFFPRLFLPLPRRSSSIQYCSWYRSGICQSSGLWNFQSCFETNTSNYQPMWPFACNYGTNKHIFDWREDQFEYGVPAH